MDFRFESNQILNYLYVLPFLLGLIIFFVRRARKRLKKTLGEKAFLNLTSSVNLTARRWKLFFQMTVLVLIILALSRPQMGKSLQEVKSEGVEVILAVDVSESMMAEDVRPNRLEQAKTELGKLTEKLAGSKIGIIAFAGNSALLSPLTNDPTALRMYLDSLSTQSVSTQGTDFKSAIEEATAAFERGGVATDSQSQVTRVLVIASDGEDHEPGALEAAQAAVQKGLRIFSLIYGTEKGAPIPERDGMGYLRGYKSDRSGQKILTTVKGDALKALAEAGKGNAYFAAFGGNHIDRLVDAINQLEKTQFESQMSVDYDEKFQMILWIVLLLMIIEIFKGDRKSPNKIWMGRFQLVYIWISFGFLTSFGYVEKSQADLPIKSYLLNREAQSLIEKKDIPAAKKKTIEALEGSPLSAAIQFNLGLCFDLAGEAENAQKVYQSALEMAKQPEEKFSILFNLGLLAQKNQKKDLALSYYQQALELNPQSKEIKINIELMTQKNKNKSSSGDSDQKDENSEENDQKKNDQSDSKDNKDNKDNKDQKDNKENKEQDGSKDSKNNSDDDNKKDPKDKKEQDQNKSPKKQKGQPQQFKSQELSEGDVKKILGEIKQQEQKIRAEFNKREMKEEPREKDW